MDSTTTMWLILGGAMLLVGALQLVTGLLGDSLESGQRTLAIFSSILLGGLAFYILLGLAAERTTAATLNVTIAGTIVAGAIVGLGIVARRKPID